MSYSVTVLLENGRRQRVPVKLTTPVLLILEDVCKKHKLTADNYDVKYHNRLLDVTCTVQFCGIVNNAQLELVPATKSRIESPVTVFVQLESGERLSGSFSPSSTLQDVIIKLCSEEELGRSPVVIYMRQEVLSDKLKTTTLKQLGLTGGSALLRLLHRTEDQLRNQSHSGVYNLPAKPKSEEPERRRKKEGTLKDFVDEKSGSKNEMVENPENEVRSPASSSQNPVLMDVDVPCATTIINEPKPSGSGVGRLESNDTRPTIPPKQEDITFNINDVKYLGERYALVFRTDQVNSPRFDDTTDDFFELTVDDAKTLLRDMKRTRSELEEAKLETAALRERKRSMMFERTVSIYPYCVVRILFSNRVVLQGVFKSTETIKEVTNFVKLFIEVSILDFYLYTAPPKKILKVTQSLLELGAIPGINLHFGGTAVEENPSGHFLRPEFLNQAVSPGVALRVANHFRRAGGIPTPQPPPIQNSSPDLSVSDDHDTDLNVLPAPPPNLRQNTPMSLGGGGGGGGGKVPKWFKPQ